MSSSLYRLGRRCAHHPWRIVRVGLLIAAIVLGILSQLGGTTKHNFTVPAVEAHDANDILDAHLPEFAGISGQVVFHADALDPVHTEAAQQAADLARSEDDKAGFGGWPVPIDIEGNKGVGLPVAALVLLFAFGSLAADHRNLPGPDH